MQRKRMWQLKSKILRSAYHTASATDDDENHESKKSYTAAAMDDDDNDESKKENDKDNDDGVDDVLPSVTKGKKNWILHWKLAKNYGNQLLTW